MSQILPPSVAKLAQLMATLPGIGPKSADRLTFYLINQPDAVIEKFAESFAKLKENLKRCRICQIIASQDPCVICLDTNRDRSIIAIVEETLDVVALEKARFQGVYHVLGGQISPLNRVSPDDLTIKELLARLKSDKDAIVKELILATDPSLEGEATSLYIADQIKKARSLKQVDENLRITRIARGLPVGGDLEYADELTISRSLEGRREYQE